MERINEKLKLRNGLSLKLADADYRAICDLAYKIRIPVATMIRDIIVNHLKKGGVDLRKIKQ